MCFLKLGRRPCADWWVAGEVFATGIAFHHLSSNLYLFIHNSHHLYFILFGVVFVSWQKRPPLAKERWKRTRTSPSFVSDCLCCHREPYSRSEVQFSIFIFHIAHTISFLYLLWFDLWLLAEKSIRGCHWQKNDGVWHHHHLHCGLGHRCRSKTSAK